MSERAPAWVGGDGWSHMGAVHQAAESCRLPELSIGTVLREYRTAVGVTQAELARRAGLSLTEVRDLEQGRRVRPRAASVARLAEALGLNPSDTERVVAAAREHPPVTPSRPDNQVGSPPAAHRNIADQAGSPPPPHVGTGDQSDQPPTAHPGNGHPTAQPPTAQGNRSIGQQAGPPATGAQGLWIQVLGPVVAWRDGERVDLGPARPRAVLALLALGRGAAVSRDAIVEMLWPTGRPASAVTMVQAYLSLLRRRLDPGRAPGDPDGLVTGEGESYRLRASAADLDLMAFERFAGQARVAGNSGQAERACDLNEQALALWRGEPAADVTVLREDSTVTGLALGRAGLVVEYAQAACPRGWHDRVLGHLRVLAALEPLNEQAHAWLMIALAGTGQQAGALRVFADCRERLGQRLGVLPGDELTWAHDLVLRQAGPAGSPNRKARHTPAPASDNRALHAKPATANAKPATANGKSAAPNGKSAAPNGKPVAADGKPELARGKKIRQLPGRGRTFVGRRAELNVLVGLAGQAAAGRAGAVCAIGGRAGVGKTTLAVWFAHRCADAFPDGHLYVDLRGFGPSGPPVSSDQALRGFLAALDVPPEQVPEDPGERSALFRRLVAGKRILVVLDNARDEPHVRPLLPGGASSLTLVTSRRELTGLAATEGAALLRLGLPSQAESLELLSGLLGAGRIEAEPEAAADLTRLCARLPLGLAIAAARAAASPGSPLTAAAAGLREAGHRLAALDAADAANSWSAEPEARTATTGSGDAASWTAAEPDARAIRATEPDTEARATRAARANDTDTTTTTDADDAAASHTGVRAVFYWSYQSLTEPAARMFRLLGLHPGPDISLPAAASLAGLPPTEAAKLLAELARAHLVINHTPAINHAPASNRTPASNYTPASGNTLASRHAPASDHTQVTERTAARFGCHDLLRALAAEQALQADSEPDRRAATQRMLDHYLHTALAGERLLNTDSNPPRPGPATPGTTPERLDTYQQALTWFEAEHDVLRMVIALAAATGFDVHAWHIPQGLVSFFIWRGRWHDWVDTQQIALASAHRAGDVGAVALAHFQLGRIYRHLGPQQSAESHLAAALTLWRDTGDRPRQADALHAISHLRFVQERYDQAISDDELALGLYREVGHRPGEANALNNLGWLHAMLGQREPAITRAQQAIDLSAELGYPFGEAQSWDTLGFVRHVLNDHAGAILCFKQALALCQGLGSRYYEALTLTHLGDTHQAAGNQHAAAAAWRDALRILDRLQHADASRVRARLDSIAAAQT